MFTARVLSAMCASIGFAVSVLAGLRANNPFEIILDHALVAMAACFATGYVVGLMGGCIAREHASRVSAAEKAAAKVAAGSAEVTNT
jgi:hypothetical protein